MAGVSTHGARIDKKRLEQVVLTVHEAQISSHGIFATPKEVYLPQWNLPSELEYSPRQLQTRDPKSAAKYLWTRLFCDRLSQSSTLMTFTQKTWYDNKKNWIFEPSSVINRDPTEVEILLREEFKFAIKNAREKDNGTRYWNNAKKLVEFYDNDPRNIINYKTSVEASAHLVQFEGIGRGLANLYIMEMHDRRIASPLDPENARFKIDRHKAGISVYTGAAVPYNHQIDFNSLVPQLEKMYTEICEENKLNPQSTDAALWVIGSQICAQKNFWACINNCPLADKLCISRTPLNGKSGKFIVLTKDGKRVETRTETGQSALF